MFGLCIVSWQVQRDGVSMARLVSGDLMPVERKSTAAFSSTVTDINSSESLADSQDQMGFFAWKRYGLTSWQWLNHMTCLLYTRSIPYNTKSLINGWLKAHVQVQLLKVGFFFISVVKPCHHLLTVLVCVCVCNCSMWLWHGPDRLLREERRLPLSAGLPEASRHALQQL